jgi:uncharacterized protein (UPF0276 family)
VEAAAEAAGVEADVAAEVTSRLRSEWISRLPRLGVGIGFRRPLAQHIIAHGSEVDFLEIISEHYFDLTRFARRELGELRARFRLVPHGLGLSPGAALPPPKEYLRSVERLARLVDAPWWSDHLAITRAGSIDIGHLAPVFLTEDALMTTCENINRATEAVGRPFIIENIAYTFRPPGAEMSEAAFLSRVLEQTDSGLLLDLMNLYANAVNHGYDPYRFLDEIPLERVVQVHIIGGHFAGGILIDSHSRATPDAVWRLLEYVAARTEIKAVLLEWDEDFPCFEVILEELDRARAALARLPQTERIQYARG